MEFSYLWSFKMSLENVVKSFCNFLQRLVRVFCFWARFQDVHFVQTHKSPIWSQAFHYIFGEKKSNPVRSLGKLGNMLLLRSICWEICRRGCNCVYNVCAVCHNVNPTHKISIFKPRSQQIPPIKGISTLNQFFLE